MFPTHLHSTMSSIGFSPDLCLGFQTTETVALRHSRGFRTSLDAHKSGENIVFQMEWLNDSMPRHDNNLKYIPSRELKSWTQKCLCEGIC